VNVDVTMPQLGETVAEGTVTRWLRQVGEAVEDQEPLVEIAADKVDTEVPSPAAGTLLEIRVPADSTVAVGTVIAVIGEPNRSVEPPLPPTVLASAPPERLSSRTEHVTPVVARAAGTRHRHSPLIRRLARESGVDLEDLVGTGPAGRIMRADVAKAAATADRAAPVSDTIVTPRVVAPSPPASIHATCVVEVDMSNVVALRDRVAPSLDEGNDGRETLAALVVGAVVQALRAYPVLNASIDPDGRIVHNLERQHIGITVDTHEGVVVPVIKDAGDLNPRGLSRRIADVTARAGHGALLPADLTAGTFTVANTGSRGVLFDTPILVLGQAGIVGTGDIVERAVVVRRPDSERAIAIRSMAYLSLTYDHRLVDGATAARFLTFVQGRLQAERSHSELS
jgi:pyruvate dehydrogenase E2 component (dihydrolipoyllysine-residue acetyltransferase)